MTATSHAITGAAIALAVKEPVLALPLAFVSHFILDTLPHFAFSDGENEFESRKKYHKHFRLLLYVDAVLLAVFMIYLFVSGAGLLVFTCLFLAGSPDFIWAYRYIFKEDFGKKPFAPMNVFNRFHSNIQKFDRPAGILFEVPYMLAVLVFAIIKL